MSAATTAAPPTLADRRDAREVKRLARQLILRAEAVPIDGAHGFKVVPARAVVELLYDSPELGDELLVVIRWDAFDDLKQAAGIGSIEAELAAKREIAEHQASQRVSSGPGIKDITVTPAVIRELLKRRCWTETRLVVALMEADCPGVTITSVSSWLAGTSTPSHKASSEMLRLLGEMGSAGIAPEPEQPPPPPIPIADEPPMNAEELRQARKALGLTNVAFAGALGVPFGDLQRWMRTDGTDLSVERRRQIRELVERHIENTGTVR